MRLAENFPVPSATNLGPDVIPLALAGMAKMWRCCLSGYCVVSILATDLSALKRNNQ